MLGDLGAHALAKLLRRDDSLTKLSIADNGVTQV
jgi:hypothetical protein